MELTDIGALIVSLILVALGMYIKMTTNREFKTSKKYWRLLIVIGVISFLLNLLAIALR